MSYFDQWMASDGAWDVTEQPRKCNTSTDARNSVNCQRVRRFRYSGKRYSVTLAPPIFQTLLFILPESLENGGSKCYSVTRPAKRWKPYRFHAGDAFEGFPLRWPERSVDVPGDWTKVRIIPRDEVLESANIARRHRSRDLIAMMHDCNVDEWTWAEHPDGTWRAHHSNIFGG